MLPSANDFISLSRAEISHVDYHWFWGLRYNKRVQTPNMMSRLDELLQDDGLFQSLQAQQARIEEYYFMTRLFYRWFNIDNYTLNAYTLVFLDAYEEYQAQEANVMYSDATSGIPEGQSKPSWSQWARDNIVNFCERSGLLSTEPDTSVSESSEAFQETWVEVAEALSPPFKVTSAMLPYLVVLGLDVNHGDSLTEADVKRAYRKALLCAHPDKGGSVRLFHNLQAAKKQLDCLLSSEDNASVSDDEYFRDAINEIIRSYVEMHCKLDEMEQRITRLEQMSQSTSVEEEYIPVEETNFNSPPYKMICN